MVRKALVDYSLIKEICENLRTKNKKFKGQLDLPADNEPSKKAKKDTKEIRKLLVTKAFEKATKIDKPRKRKRSAARFSQNSRADEKSSSSSESESSSGSRCESSDELISDEEARKNDDVGNSTESDSAPDTTAET